MSTATTTFHLRRKGQIIGPFARTQIRVMARRGDIALTDEMSLNGGQWIPVGSTPLAGEIPRKAAITLREPGRAPAAGDSSVVVPPGGSSSFPAVRKSDSSMFFSRNAAEPVAGARAEEELFQTRSSVAFPKPAGGPHRVPPRSPPLRAEPASIPVVEDPLAGWDTGPARPAPSAYRRRPARRRSGDSSMEIVLVIMAVVLLIGVVIIAVFVARSRSQPPVVVVQQAAGDQAPAPVPVAPAPRRRSAKPAVAAPTVSAPSGEAMPN